jgi:hypothetical protein
MLAPLFLGLTLVPACAATPPTPADSRSQSQIQWEQIRSWSGRGSQQLDSFPSEGTLRIEWEAKRVAGASAPGWLKIIVHSAISGRPLAAPVVDQRGEGKGIAYFSEEPRVFFMEVTSEDLEWKIAVFERVR